jgi:hypothetical protein
MGRDRCGDAHVLLEQPLEQRVRAGLQIRRRGELLRHDLAVQVLLRASLKRRPARHHLEAERSQSPPVHAFAVARTGKHLRGLPHLSSVNIVTIRSGWRRKVGLTMYSDVPQRVLATTPSPISLAAQVTSYRPKSLSY